jgi:GNAT superfamily N-acetyltransferase
VTPFVTESLSREHDRSAFSSGVDVLDRYLREFALQDMRRRVAGCFVALNDSRAVMGFYTLAATSVTLDALPSDLTKRLPRYPLVPAVLMGRLAVAVEYQGQGLGKALIFDAAIRRGSPAHWGFRYHRRRQRRSRRGVLPVQWLCPVGALGAALSFLLGRLGGSAAGCFRGNRRI